MMKIPCFILVLTFFGQVLWAQQDVVVDAENTYYNIAKQASLSTYQRKIAVLQNEKKAKKQLLAELGAQFGHEIKTQEEAIALLNQQKWATEQQIRRMAEKWATVKIGDENPFYQRAFAAFQGQNIELAKAILDSAALEKHLEFISREKAKDEALPDTLQKNAEKRAIELQQYVNMCLLKANLHQLGYEWTEAERCYDVAVQYNKANLDIIDEAAIYLPLQNQYKKVQRYYEDALQIERELARKKHDDFSPDVVVALLNLGVLLEQNNCNVEAKKYYEEALVINRELAAKYPDVYTFELVMNLNNLGILLDKNDDAAAAKLYFEEALQINRSVVDKNPEIHTPCLVDNLRMLGLLSGDNNDFATAEKYFQEELQIRRKLAEGKSNLLLKGVAGTLSNLGILLGKSNKVAEARQCYEEALLIYRKLADNRPDVYLPDLAGTNYIVGVLLWQNKDMGDAKSYIEEALLIYRKLADNYPNIYLSNLADIMLLSGLYSEDNDDVAGAKKYYEDALLIYRKLADENPKKYTLGLLVTEVTLGFLYTDILDAGGDPSLKKEGIQLMKAASKHLAFFPESDPIVQDYLPDIEVLTRFFEQF